MRSRSSIITIESLPSLSDKTELSFPTVAAAVEQLESLGIVRELTGKRRNRLFVYERDLAILSEGTEPL